MKAFVLTLISLLPVFATHTSAAELDADLRAPAQQLAALLSDGYAEVQPENFSFVPSDTSQEVAVFFFLIGPAKGNGSWQFLAFFDRNQEIDTEYPVASPYRLIAFKQIGFRGSRFFSPETALLHNGVLTVSGKKMAPDDPMCCPSIAIHSTFVITDGSIVEKRGK